MDNKKLKKANSNSASAFDQAKKIIKDFIKQLKDKEFKALLQKCDDEYAAVPTDGLTDENLQDMSEHLKFQQDGEYIRNVLNAFKERAGDLSNAKLVQFTHNGLDLLNQIEKGNYSLCRELDNTLNTVIELCCIEDRERQASGKAGGGIQQTSEINKAKGGLTMVTEKASKENWEKIKSEYGCSKMELAKKINFVKDAFKRKIILRDVEHAFVLASHGFAKPAVILAGGVIEELLKEYLKYKKIKPNTDRFTDYIKACGGEDGKEGLLNRGVSRLSDAIRDFRNLVHISNEESKRYTISMATAKGAVSSIFSIANDFH